MSNDNYKYDGSVEIGKCVTEYTIVYVDFRWSLFMALFNESNLPVVSSDKSGMTYEELVCVFEDNLNAYYGSKPEEPFEPHIEQFKHEANNVLEKFYYNQTPAESANIEELRRNERRKIMKELKEF